jgi:hypothetical protein
MSVTVFAETKSKTEISFKKFGDSELEISFMAPNGVVMSQPKEKLNNPLLLNGKTFARIEWPGMMAQIDMFDVEYGLNHVDWLTAYTALAEFETGTIRTLENRNKFIFGMIKYKTTSDEKEYSTAFLALDNKHGYLISGDGIKSDPLVKTIADTFILSGKNINETDKTQTIKFSGHDLKFRNDFTVRHESKKESIVKIISNASTVSDSSTIFLLKTGTNSPHENNVRKFKKELSSLKITSKVLLNKKTETTFLLKTSDDRNFVGFIHTAQSGESVSLITPSIEEDVNSWLSGKYYYIKTVQALK